MEQTYWQLAWWQATVLGDPQVWMNTSIMNTHTFMPELQQIQNNSQVHLFAHYNAAWQNPPWNEFLYPVEEIFTSSLFHACLSCRYMEGVVLRDSAFLFFICLELKMLKLYNQYTKEAYFMYKYCAINLHLNILCIPTLV